MEAVQITLKSFILKWIQIFYVRRKRYSEILISQYALFKLPSLHMTPRRSINTLFHPPEFN